MSRKPGGATVLAVAHTVTATTRLLDLLPVFEGDHRITVSFSAIPGSSFSAGVAEFISDIGGRDIPWNEAIQRPFDLAISAGNSGELHKIKAPLIIIPHGIGYNKYLNRESRIANREPGVRSTGWHRSSSCTMARSSLPASSYPTRNRSPG